MTRVLYVFLLALLFATAGCTANSNTLEPEAEAAPAQTEESAPLASSTPAIFEPPTSNDAQATRNPGTEGAIDQADSPPEEEDTPGAEGDGVLTLADAKRLARADLAARRNITAQQIEVVETAVRTWPDETMGCGSRRIVVESQPVAGFQIVLVAGDHTYDYRVSEQGALKLCPDEQDVGKPLDPIR